VTSPSDDADRARLRELLQSSVGSIEAGHGLARRAVVAYRRRQRRVIAVTAAVAALVVGGGSALGVTLATSGGGRPLLAVGGTTPPSPTSAGSHDVCGGPRPGEVSIAPSGGSPYLSAPPSARGSDLPVAREAAVRAVRASAVADVLKNATIRLSQVRTLGPKGTCVTSVDWVLYSHPDPLTVMGGGVNSTCVAYTLVDARTLHVSGETIACASHPAPNCSAKYVPPAAGGAMRTYGQIYKKLPSAAGIWTKLPNSPLPPRMQPVVAWTGKQLIVWGGQSGPEGRTLHSDGASYDPTTKTWTTLSPAPMSARVDASAVWTGTELVIWGGYVDLSSTLSIRVTNSGAAYNPSTRTWRALPKSPLEPARGPGIAWTGSEVVILDGQPAVMTDAFRGERQAAAWNPVTNRWRTLPREPAGTPKEFNVTVAHWADNRLLVFHGYVITSDPSATTVDSYNPTSNRWTHLPKCGGASYVGAAYDIDGKVLIPPDYTADGFLYDPQTNTWTPLPAAPLASAASAITPGGGLLLVNSGIEGYDIRPGDAAFWDSHTDSWAKTARLPVGPGEDPTAVDAGDSVLLWTGNDQAQLYAFTP
jgi:N-acetylneuraminic acid mutarotase